MNAVLGIVIGLLAGLAIIAAIKACNKAEVQPASKEHAHSWEPWSEPKDAEIRSWHRPYYAMALNPEVEVKEYVAKYQERVCAECNEYARRWI
jgi:hypothetical protein